MTITTEEAEWLAALHKNDAVRFAPGMPGRELRQNTAATIRSLAAERDALQARVAELGGALRDARARYIELNDKDATEAMAEIINKALADAK